MSNVETRESAADFPAAGPFVTHRRTISGPGVIRRVSLKMDRLRYELRALGIGLLGLPLLVVAVFVGVALLAAFDTTRSGGATSTAHADLARGLLFLVEFGLPPVAGFAASYLVATDPAKELHLSLPVPYRITIERRLALFTLWTMLVCVVTTLVIAAAGYWIAPQPAPLNQLTWLAPLLWFVASGALLALLLGSWVAGSALLGMVWLGVIFFRFLFFQHRSLHTFYLFLTLATVKGGEAPDASYWVANRLTLIGMAVAFCALVVLLLRRNEALLGHES
jgi:hypothetical protein